MHQGLGALLNPLQEDSLNGRSDIWKEYFAFMQMNPSVFLFGSGFGSAYPAFAAYVMGQVDAARRGAAFGGILAAFDTGIGTGSVLTGLIIDRFGYSRAYVAAAFLAALSITYFLFAERRLRRAAGARTL